MIGMGNEMGNANVAGLEEEKNGEPEAGNKPIETSIADSNENNVIAEKQPVSLPNDENYHEDVDPSGLNNHRGNEETLAKFDSDYSEEQDGFLNDLLISKGSNDEEKGPLSTGKEETTYEKVVVSDTTPAETGGNFVLDQKEGETANTKIQLASNGTNEEPARSVISSEDGSYHEMESDYDNSLPETSDDKIHRSTRTEGEELTSAPDMQLPLLKSEFIAFNNQDSDQLKTGNNNNEPHVELVQRSNSGDQALSKFDHCDDTGKELEKENETEHMLDGSACAYSIEKSEVENLGDRIQVEVESFQEDTLLKMNKIYDLRLEFKAGDVVGKTLDNEDVENGEEQRFMTPDFDKKDSTDSHLELISVSTSLESLQKENSQAEDKFIVLTNDAHLFNGPEFEQKRNILNANLVSQESQEKSKVGMMESSNSEYTGMGVDPEADNKVTAPSEVNKYTLGTDLQTTEEKAIGIIGHHVALRDINTSSVREEDAYSDQEPETRDVISSHPIELWVVDTKCEDAKCSVPLLGSNVEEPVPEKGELQDCLEKDDEETVALKAVSFNLGPTKPDTSIPLPSVESQSQVPKPFLPAMAIGTLENWRNTNLELAQESYEEVDVGKILKLHAEVSREEAPMKQKTCSISTDQPKGQDMHVYQSDHTIGYDSKMNLGSPDSNESYTTAYEQEHLIPNIGAREESSFRIDDQIAQTMFVGMLADFNQHAELSREGEAEFSKKTSLKYEEKTIGSEVFKASVSELYASEVGVSVASPVLETTILAPQEEKEIPSEELSQEQTSEEKQVTTPGRTNSEKLDIHIPLLSFLKDETYYMGSQHKQETLVAKKTTEDKCNTREKKARGVARQREAKRKQKPLLFNICMCCTPDIP